MIKARKDSKVSKELERQNNISIVDLLNFLLEEAHEFKASDIHIDPSGDDIRVRLRVDGSLQDFHHFPKKIHSEIIARIKVLSRLRIDEQRNTQDGRFRYSFPDSSKYIDIRVSIAPTYYGENAVLRLLFEKTEGFSLQNLGFDEMNEKSIMNAIKKTSGMILITGPTGSGKTTTLYTLIKMLNKPDVSIITIEDPIEYAISGVEQIQVNANFGLTFANGLRTILRQDPNIIMVGEIRDSETARIAINSALTGHLLFSTLHTSDAITTLPRLFDIGIETYLVASTTNIVVAQRLVRKICNFCKKECFIKDDLKHIVNASQLSKFLNEESVIYKGIGCKSCDHSGYDGRICINEVLVMNEEIKEAVYQKKNSSFLKDLAISTGMKTMLEDGVQKILKGKTTIEEVLRVLNE